MSGLGKSSKICAVILANEIGIGNNNNTPKKYKAVNINQEQKEGSDLFQLYDLKVEVLSGEKPMVCDHQQGEHFFVIGENIIFPEEGRKSFPLYPLAALLPLLPAKQRFTEANDWMTTDAVIACPDPHCGGQFKISRQGLRTFSHAETTVVPLPESRQ